MKYIIAVLLVCSAFGAEVKLGSTSGLGGSSVNFGGMDRTAPDRVAASAPTSCVVGDTWYDTANAVAKRCSVSGTPGTWVADSGGVASVAGDDGIVVDGTTTVTVRPDWTVLPGLARTNAWSGTNAFLPDASQVVLREEFQALISSTSAQIGMTRLQNTGTCPATTLVASEANHHGILEIATPATAASDCALTLGATASFPFNQPFGANWAGWVNEFVFKTDATAVTDSRYIVGLNTSSVYSSSAHFAGLYVNTFATLSCTSGSIVAGNIGYLVQNGATANTCYDTGVALAAATWYKFRMTWTGTGVTFQYAAAGAALSAGQTLSTNLPTSAGYLWVAGLTNVNGAANARKLWADKFEFVGWGVTR